MMVHAATEIETMEEQDDNFLQTEAAESSTSSIIILAQSQKAMRSSRLPSK